MLVPGFLPALPEEEEGKEEKQWRLDNALRKSVLPSCHQSNLLSRIMIMIRL